MIRDKYPTRTIRLIGEVQLKTAHTILDNVPIDSEHPLEVVIREEVKKRGLDHNSAYWAGPLADIAAQAYIGGRTYSADVWHFHFKVLYLLEEFDPELCLAGYRKWDITPSGERVLVGSTTQLTVKGFAQYLTQVEADGAGMGVQFRARE